QPGVWWQSLQLSDADLERALVAITRGKQKMSLRLEGASEAGTGASPLSDPDVACAQRLRALCEKQGSQPVTPGPANEPEQPAKLPVSETALVEFFREPQFQNRPTRPSIKVLKAAAETRFPNNSVPRDSRVKPAAKIAFADKPIDPGGYLS